MKGQKNAPPSLQLSELTRLPRPVYGHAQALPNVALGYRHRHPWGQLSHATHGVLHVQTDAGRYVVPPQRAVWIPAGVAHSVNCTQATCIRSLYIEPQVMIWPSSACRVISVNPLLRELIRSFSELPVEYAVDSADGRLVEVLVDQLGAAAEEQLILPMPRDNRLRTLCRRLYKHPDDSASLTDLSLKAGVSEKTLSRLFLHETGMTFRAWRQRMRLLSALPALERGERVTDVALACGYESLPAFIAAFGKQFGLTPGAFLRLHTPH
ncbi:AraC family transcriptional regulator [Pseudomonas fontis]|uniref:Helix-turn-helix transcriptional regulator n=1 Tax=Pseudomonas fontis TaxID=2942633 RepID=A0ABT5NZ58_9PSED|nr:helix-turn-helix transcriptional regulator [Pseudomonas fontis]MDD0977149.1 helix-turn-helix transcriptional regulator [Pseudomonas fontis]MDD0993412.1 helix-turn-helix transcriptional regulator [Pseudomonas fontis]